MNRTRHRKSWTDNFARDLGRRESSYRIICTNTKDYQSIANHYQISRPTLIRGFKELSKQGILTPVIRGVYVNEISPSQVQNYELVPYIRNDAIVSLDYVLNQSKVITQNTDIVTCILPIYKDKNTNPKVGLVETPRGIFRFHGINDLILSTIHQKLTRASLSIDSNVMMHTPEAAFLYYLYLANEHRSSIGFPDLPNVQNLKFKNVIKIAKLVDHIRHQRMSPFTDSNIYSITALAEKYQVHRMSDAFFFMPRIAS